MTCICTTRPLTVFSLACGVAVGSNSYHPSPSTLHKIHTSGAQLQTTAEDSSSDCTSLERILSAPKSGKLRAMSLNETRRRRLWRWRKEKWGRARDVNHFRLVWDLAATAESNDVAAEDAMDLVWK